jgi:hypothetical protein
MDKEREAAAGITAATASKSQSITKKKMSPQEQQYLKAIGMSSAELGAVIKAPTERIAQHVGDALAHDLAAKKDRDEAQIEFQQNIAFYYEAKQRLLNPGYRTDVDGGKNRTPDENEKNFGAPDWASFANKCGAYSLQHADRLLKAFAKANGLLTDEGENIDDPEPKEGEGAGQSRGRRAEDPTAQKRYEFIATAAMEIANRNPEGEVEKQILAAAEYDPAPLMPVSPNLFAEILSFITQISTTAADKGVRAEAKQLVNKMRLHKPAADPAKVPAEAAKEEKRKRDNRLAKKNGRPLGSAACSPPTDGTPEHVQKFAPLAGGRDGVPPENSSADYRLRKAKAQADTPAAPQEAGPQGMTSQDAPQPAATPTPTHRISGDAWKPPASVKVKVLPPALSPEEEERRHGTLGATPDRPGRRQGDFVLKEDGKWECEPELGMGEAEEIRNAQPGQLPPRMASAAKPCRVKKRVKGDNVHSLVIRDGDRLPEEVFNSKGEAEEFCECLNSPPAAGILPQEANDRSAAQSVA